MPKQNSIYAAKFNFLRSQVRVLEKLPQLPPDWRDDVPQTEHGDLSDTVLQQIFYKLSVVARKHNDMVYSSQALRLIAEQVDALYWEAQLGFEGDAGTEEAVLKRGVDLRSKENIDALPEHYPHPEGEGEDDLEQYQELRSRLVHSSEVLAAQRQKHAYYSRLRKLLEPFENPRESVQPNLVVRNSQLGEELTRMKGLLAVLTLQIERAKAKGIATARGGSEQPGDDEASAGERLLALLSN